MSIEISGALLKSAFGFTEPKHYFVLNTMYMQSLKVIFDQPDKKIDFRILEIKNIDFFKNCFV